MSSRLAAGLAVALAVVLAAPPAAAADLRALPTGGDLAAPFLVSDLTDLQEESHISVASDGAAIAAGWETDDRHADASPDDERLEFCEASFLVAGRWSNPFPVSVVGGVVTEGHFLRTAAADGHFLFTCLLVETNGFVVSVVLDNATFPARSFVVEAEAGAVLGRPSAAGLAGRDFVAAISHGGSHAPPAGDAALVFPLPAADGPVGAPEVAWSGGDRTLGDTVLVNASGRLALVVEYANTSDGPSQVGVSFRAGPDDWGPLLPLTGAAADRFNRQVSVFAGGGRLLLAFERQRAPESLFSEVAFVEVGAAGEVVRDTTVSPPSSGASHAAPSVTVFQGRATVAWETDDDSLSPGGRLASFYRTVDGAALGPVTALSPPGDAGTNGPPRLVTDGPRLFGLWVSDSPALADGPDLDIVGRYIGGDFDRDGLLDAVDETPAGPPPGGGGAGPETPEPAPAGAVPFTAAAVAGAAGVGFGVAAALLPKRRRPRPSRRPPSA